MVTAKTSKTFCAKEAFYSQTVFNGKGALSSPNNMTFQTVCLAVPLLWYLFGVTFLWSQVEGASFYGASYVRLPLEDAKSTTEIQFKFKTHRSDAVLFLAAGTTDYCLLVIESGGLKVRINLGAGESELVTPQGLRFDDLAWHTVKLHRVDANLTFTVDGFLQSRLTIPGRFYELNIHYGIFVGGMGDFRELFLGILEPYRGCLDDLTYNGVDVFKQARDLPDQSHVHMVTWDCSAEFDATSDKPFSVVTQGAFLAFPTMSARNGASFAAELKTQANTSVLLYNTGIPSESDFVAVEIVHGHVRLAVDKGNGLAELVSEVAVNDGLWHRVEVRFGPTYMEVVVDDHVASSSPSLGENRHLDLIGPMYVGGIELNRRARAVAQGLLSMQNLVHEDGAFRGCLGNLRVNDASLGLREAQVAFGVRPECVWDYPCMRSPCVDRARCVQEGLDGFRCLCDLTTSCVKPDYNDGYKIYASHADPSDLEILELQPLHVKEGGSELVTSNHIDVAVDFQQYDIRESAVLFHVVEQPRFGNIRVDVWHQTGNNLFTLLDLNSDKVHYEHDGSENFQDSVTLELEFLTRRVEGLPQFLMQRHRFIFHVTVTPVNDPPEIRLPPGRVLRLAQNTRKPITPDILSASDLDNDPKDLVFTVLGLGSDGEGQLENSRYPGKPAETFTQEDVNNGLISYVHRGTPNARVALKVSDGRETSPTAVLRIVAFQLEIHMVNNTGITVAYNSYAFILSENLTFATNAAELDKDVRYDITRLPHYGHVQLLRHGEHWQTVTHFPQMHIVRDRIRYLHTSGRPKHDDFKFTVSCNGITTPTVYDFRITFTKSKVEVVNNVELMLENVQERQIGPEHLRSETFPHPTEDGAIVYSLVSAPSYGALVLAVNAVALQSPPPKPHRHGHVHRPQKLGTGNNFTQNDINAGNVKYRLHHRAYSVIRDSFEFRVASLDATSDVTVFRVNHVPSERDASVILGILEVAEGESATLSDKVLDIRIPGVEAVQYRLTEAPEHGRLELRGTPAADSILNFTSHDVHDGKLAYVHDDSEHDHDRLGFQATALDDTGPDFLYVGAVPVRVVMKNDMQPEREVDRVFHVVTNGQRVITSRDLRFVDTDLGTLPSDLQYTRRGIPNGAIVRADSPDSQVFQFTQQDIDDGRILFRHKGESYGRAALWISDGKYFVSSILEIRASDPFLSVLNNTGAVVKRGHSAVISGTNLSIDSNLNAKPSDIRFLVSIPPGHGSILKDGKPETEFTQDDLYAGKVTYQSDGGTYFRDNFNFEVHAFDNRADGEFELRVYPESYWEPLEISGNWTVKVDEGRRVTIDPTVMSVKHPNVDSREITYVVKRPPQHGYLATDVSLDGYAAAVNGRLATTTVFDQATVDERRVKYVHTERNATDDSVYFDVTNGIVTTADVRLTLEIVPKNVVLRTANLTVAEGKAVALSDATVAVANKHFLGTIQEYVVKRAPVHGTLKIADLHGQSSRTELFTPAQLTAGRVAYHHDGSETIGDTFVVVGRSKNGERQSLPATVGIAIQPLNDEIPVVRRNVKLEVWQGSTTVLTMEYLETTDNDTIPDELMYSVITSPTNGYLALADKPKERLLNFTQAMVNQGKVAFVHAGDTDGSFLFHVSDGVHTSESHIFAVRAKPISLQLRHNQKLYVFPSLQQTLTWQHLLAVTSDWDPKRSITFGIKNGGPRLGKLVRLDEDGTSYEVSSFTQEHVNRSLVVYKHTEPFAELVATDSFDFDVKCPNADALKNLVFQVEISVITINPDGLQQYVLTSPVSLDEGGQATIDHRHLNTTKLSAVLNENRNARFVPKLLMAFHQLPMHGVIGLKNSNVTGEETQQFTQQDVDSGMVTYTHDHSDTIEDQATVAVYLENGVAVTLLLNVTLHVRIRPINDQNFELLTTSPRIEVVQGQAVQISPQHLKTVDSDTPPADIRYDIISGPSDGKVVLHPDVNRSVTSFTQLDIDDHKLWYVQEGSLDTASFHFKVSDGAFKPVYAVFNVHVVQLTLELVNHSAIDVVQGTTSTYLKRQNLGALTNGNHSQIRYEVTLPPKHGHLFVNDVLVHSFSQEDVDHERVLYVQLNMSASADFFRATVRNEDLRLDDRQFAVVVRPLIRQNPAQLVAGWRLVLSLDILDATQLAEKTKSNPLFTIVQLPKYGHLRRVYARRRGQSKRDSSMADDLHHFTHEDLVNGAVAYETRDVRVLSAVNDSFGYVLTAAGVQPARGALVFQIQPRGARTPVLSTRPVPHVPSSEEDVHYGPAASSPKSPTGGGFREVDHGIEDSSPALHPSLTDDHLLIIALVVGVVLLTVLIVVVVKCAIRKRGKKPPKCTATRSSIAANGGPLPPPMLDVDTHYQCAPGLDLKQDLGIVHYEDGDELEDPNGSIGRGTTPPIGTRSRPTSPRLRSHSHSSVQSKTDPSASLRGTPSAIPEEEWSEVSSAVPTCKVTPLAAQTDPIEVNETTLKYPYSFVEPGSLDGWGMYDQCNELPYPRPTNPMLRKNQYWV